MMDTDVQEFLTAKHDAVFKTIVIDEAHPEILEGILSNILGGSPKIISWPRTVIPNTTTKEKAKDRDLVVELDGRYINLEVATGQGSATRSQLFTYLASMWKQNIIRGGAYDTKTLFLQIVLQFGLSSNVDLIKSFKMQHFNTDTNKSEVWVENVEIIQVNMERLKKMWYDGSNKDIKKYKYLMMIDMNREELEALKKSKESDVIVNEYANKICELNDRPNFINTIGKEKEREYVRNTEINLAHDEGRAEGRKEGIEQGQVSLIRNMISNGLTVEEVSKLINVSVDEINKLLN